MATLPRFHQQHRQDVRTATSTVPSADLDPVPGGDGEDVPRTPQGHDAGQDQEHPERTQRPQARQQDDATGRGDEKLPLAASDRVGLVAPAEAEQRGPQEDPGRHLEAVGRDDGGRVDQRGRQPDEQTDQGPGPPGPTWSGTTPRAPGASAHISAAAIRIA